MDNFGEEGGKLTASVFNNTNKILVELDKYSRLETGILNAVEDLKLLISSKHDITPDSLSEIQKPHVTDIDGLIRGMNNNPTTMLEPTERKTNNSAIEKILTRFDIVDQWLAVIKKYVKHGTSSSADPSNGMGHFTHDTNSLNETADDHNNGCCSRDMPVI